MSRSLRLLLPVLWPVVAHLGALTVQPVSAFWTFLNFQTPITDRGDG